MTTLSNDSSKQVRWKWTVSPWHSARSFWGIEVLRRPRLRHSQIRVHLGRRHLTLHAISFVERQRV